MLLDIVVNHPWRSIEHPRPTRYPHFSVSHIYQHPTRRHDPSPILIDFSADELVESARLLTELTDMKPASQLHRTSTRIDQPLDEPRVRTRRRIRMTIIEPSDIQDSGPLEALLHRKIIIVS